MSLTLGGLHLSSNSSLQNVYLNAHLPPAEELKKQLAEGAVVGGVDFAEATALHLAAVYGHADAAEILLRAGAQPNPADRQAALPGQASTDAVLTVVQLGRIITA